MHILALDAEYNQPSKKTIQVGAAVFDCKSGKMLESISILVNPNEPINPNITELTGIKDSDVFSEGVNIQDAYLALAKLHKTHKCFRNPLVWGSGTSNDSDHIYQEYLQSIGKPSDDSFLKKENVMGFRVLDVKTLYQSHAIFNGLHYAGGLSSCMERLGLQFEGSPHNAMYDAINAFKVWHFITKSIYLDLSSAK